MAIDLSKTPRWLTLALLAMASTVAVPGCASESEDAALADGEEDEASVDDITKVKHTDVKRQSIGNCWIYAAASWMEALVNAATNESLNTSESWLTYWHWYEEIAHGSAFDRGGKLRTEIETGGSFELAIDLVTRYGVVLEKDFIPEEANAEMSNRQSTALAAMNRSLKEGALKDPAARRDKALVRKELNAAWGLSPELVARMDRVFGPSTTRTLDTKSFARRNPGNGIIHARNLKARIKDPQTKQFIVGTLADVIGRSGGSDWWGPKPRIGRLAWQSVDYPSNPQARRAFWKRVQAALHDEQPVVTTWNVDFNALNQSSRFSLAELQRRGPGRQGGHLTVAHDYQAEVPGIGLLKAGEQATPEQMSAAMADGTKIEFLRVKNSWGGIRPDRWSEAAIPGYHDLELAYLDGPIKWCSMKEDGSQYMSKCTTDIAPMREVVLPVGY